jgi:hypothetical protein
MFGYFIVDAIQHIQSEIHHRNGFIKKERGYAKLANQSYLNAVKLIPWENHYQLQLAKNYEDAAIKHPNEHIKFTNLAIKTYENLIKSDPLNPWFKARLGLIYHDLHKKNPSQTTYKNLAHDLALAATNNDPKNPLFTLHYGHLLYTYNDIEKAKSYYLKTLAYDSDLTEAHFNLAAIYSKENNPSESIKHYKIVHEQLLRLEKKLGKEPSQELKNKIDRFQNARINLAMHYLSENQPTMAYALISIIPVSVEKYELLAQYYEQMNQPAAAVSLYEQLNNRLKTDRYNKKINQLRQ